MKQRTSVIIREVERELVIRELSEESKDPTVATHLRTNTRIECVDGCAEEREEQIPPHQTKTPKRPPTQSEQVSREVQWTES